MHDTEITRWLKELVGTEFFKAQLALEDSIISRTSKKLANLQLSNDKLALEYAELRGALKAIEELQGLRKTLTSQSSVKGDR